MYLLFLPLLVIWEALVIKMLWSWFVVPLFFLPALSLPEAYGLSLVTRVLTYKESRLPDEDFDWKKAVWLGLSVPALALLFGFITTWFM